MKQLFASHTWRADEDGNDTHDRVVKIVRELTKFGWTVWLDEFDMHQSIDASMASGIDDSEVVIMFVTREYARKINRSARNATMDDNCFKEFNYAFFRQKMIFPVMMEQSMLNVSDWSPGVLPMKLSTLLYTDGCGPAAHVAERIHARLVSEGKRPFRCTVRRKFQSMSKRHGVETLITL